MAELGSGAVREVTSMRLSRAACIAVAMNPDKKKEMVKAAQQYFSATMTPDIKRLLEWCQQALILSKKQFATVISTIKNNLFTIASYFRNRATNASAESFNAKVKLFRTQLRGVSDTSFFIFRFTKLFA